MGMLVKGEWIDDDEKYRNSESGAFVRPESIFRDWITADGSSGFKAEPDRYHLFLAPNCPWAHRTEIIRELKGLNNTISVSLADLPRKKSWAYSQGIGDGLDPVDGVFELYQVYQAAVPDYSGRVTVPTLWDKQRKTIVNNESAEIIRMLNSEFDTWGRSDLNFYPPDLRSEIDHFNAKIYSSVNNGVYRCGFAKTQEAYAEAYDALFKSLEWLEKHLENSRFLCGHRQTEADWRLYTTLIRFDFVYHGHFKCNKFRIRDRSTLWNYLKDLYQTPGIAKITDIEGIKSGYYGSMKNVNPFGIIPLGPEDINLDEPHNRDKII